MNNGVWVKNVVTCNYFPDGVDSNNEGYIFWLNTRSYEFDLYYTPESMHPSLVGFLYDYFNDITKPTENEFRMFELQFNIDIRNCPIWEASINV